MRRLVFIGTSGSGKSTAGARAAQLLVVPHVELDELYWALNWTARPVEDFRSDVDRATSGERWVVSGNYSPVRDIVWARADTLVWLDLPFPLVFARSLTRALRRAITASHCLPAMWKPSGVHSSAEIPSCFGCCRHSGSAGANIRHCSRGRNMRI